MKYLAVFLLSLGFVSCLDSDDKTIYENTISIREYIESNNLETQVTSSGLHYIIHDTGEMPKPTINSTINVNYRGYFFNKVTFERGDNQQFSLSNLILAWQEGIPHIGTGGSITLICPPELAYGNRSVGCIPPDTPLAFDIVLNSFTD